MSGWLGLHPEAVESFFIEGLSIGESGILSGNELLWKSFSRLIYVGYYTLTISSPAPPQRMLFLRLPIMGIEFVSSL